jgi:hypothetical protein
MERFATGRIGLRSVLAGQRGSWSLIGILASVAIMMILTLILLGGPGALTGKPGKNGASNAGGAALGLGNIEGAGGAIEVRNAARKTVCANNLQQIRLALQTAGGGEQGNPATLEDLKKSVPGLQITCPVGGETYGYDPSSGRVWCVHPGHQGN